MGIEQVPGVGPIRFPDDMSREKIDTAKESLQRRTFEPHIREVAAEIGIDPDLALRIARQESRFNPAAVSKAGAQGIFQLMPDTAKELGVENSHDPKQNIRGGLTYFKRMLDEQGGDTTRALAAYNWGPGNLAKHGIEKAPEETRNYIKVIGGGGVQEPSRPLAPAAVGAPHTAGPIGPNTAGGSSPAAAEGASEAPLSVSKALLRPSYATARAFGLPQALHKVAPNVFGDPTEIAKDYESGSPGVAGTALNIVGAIPQAVAATRLAGAGITRAVAPLIQKGFTYATNPYLHTAAATALGTAATTPGDVSERATAGGLAAGLGSALQYGGRMVAEPIKRGAEAIKFKMATGEFPNPLGGGDSFLSRTISKLTRAQPGMLHVGEERAQQAAVNELWKRATPPGAHNLFEVAPSKAPRGELFNELHKQHELAYSNVLGGKQMRIRSTDRTAIDDAINRNMGDADAATAHKFIGNLKELKQGKITGEQWKHIQNQVSEQERKFLSSESAGEKNIGLAWRQVRQELNKIRDRHMTPDEVTQLTEIDKSYAYRLLLEGSASRKGAEKALTHSHIDTTMRKMATDSEVASGRAIGQDVLDPWSKTTPEPLTNVGRYAARFTVPTVATKLLGPVGGAAAIGGPYATGALAATRGGSRFLFGDLAPQQKLAEFLKYAPGTAPTAMTAPFFMGPGQGE